MTNMEIFEIKNLKQKLDTRLQNLITEFEHKTCLEVVGIYIDRIDTTNMGDSNRSSIIASVEVQAMLQPVITKEPEGGSE